MEPIRTDYEGTWTGALVPALLGAEPAPWLPAAATDARGFLLLVLDGVGWDALRDHGARLPVLSSMAAVRATTVVPSTTAAGLTSMATGLSPAEHGVLGYRMRVGGSVLNVLRWQLPQPLGGGRRPDPPDATQVQVHPPFLGKPVPIVTRAEFRGTGFTQAHLRGGRFIGWRTTATLVEHCRRLVAAREPFIYAYYDGVDKVAHEYGLRNGFYEAELVAADRLVEDLLAVLPGDYALVVTADHGQVHVGTDRVLGLEPLHRYVATYAGEGRFRSLHARPGAAADLLDAAREYLGDRAWVFPRDELFDDGWFGPGANRLLRGRVGDVVAAARADVAFADPTDPKDAKMVSRHGSLTPAEMLVPVVVGRGRGGCRRL